MRPPLNAPRHPQRRRHLPAPRRPILALLTVLTLCLAGVAPEAAAAAKASATVASGGTVTGGGNLSATSLWPHFAAPRTVLAADATELSNDDMLTATTLEGLYNGT